MSKRKAPVVSSNFNEDITDFLIELANYERNTNRNVFKYNAYRKAASVIAAYPKRIEAGKEAKKLVGVGQKISQKIDEFLKTGTLEKLEKIRKDDVSVSLNLFTRVSGIGPAKAKELVDMGLRTIDDLRKKEELLTHHQKIGLKYFEDLETKIPRAEIEEVEKILNKCIRKLDDKYSFTICGSYRRGRAESSDIDVLLSHLDYPTKKSGSPSALLKGLVEALKNQGLVIDTISLGESKFMGICKVRETARRLDIRICACDEYPCAMLYFTGSDLFNRQMRQHALDHGFTLNEYYLRPVGSTGKPGEPCKVTCERDIFEYIDMPYAVPKKRDL